jgi:hypothetical protein
MPQILVQSGDQDASRAEQDFPAELVTELPAILLSCVTISETLQIRSGQGRPQMESGPAAMATKHNIWYEGKASEIPFRQVQIVT